MKTLLRPMMAIATLTLVFVGKTFAADRPPNIVFLLADDMGYADPGYSGGNPELTPNIDRLATQSVRFTSAYANAVCAPSRAALMTGRYAFRSWLDWRSEDFGKPDYLAMLGLELPKNARGEETRMIHALGAKERTVAEALAEAGYFTALVGKWHLGEWLPEHLPRGQGFEHHYGHYAWGIDYTNYTIPHNAPARFAVYDWHRNGKPIDEQGYSTDLFANEATRLIADQSPAKPFFLMVALNAIHGPLEQIPRYTDTLDKRSAALKCLDDAIGQVVGAIEQYGFADNTLIVFANDNGGLKPEFNRPFRGTKNTNYEGGVRVPCLMRFDGRLEAGSTNDGMVHFVDFLPTLVGLAGGKVDHARPLDGIDLSSMIFERKPSPRKEIVFEVSGSVRPPAIRVKNLKLVGDELFDIESDPSESRDLAAERPEDVARLKARVAEISKERPSLASVIGDSPILMDPPLPFVYGQDENRNPPAWLIRRVESVRVTQPKEWSPGETPWPQAPKDGTIIYSGDGR